VLTQQWRLCPTLSFFRQVHAPAGSEFTAKIAPTTCETSTDLSDAAARTRQIESIDLGQDLKDLTKNTLLVNPNPFYQTAIIDFSINKAQTVHLAVYSAEGRLVQSLQNGYLTAGNHQAVFDAGWEQGGLYIIVLQTQEEVLTKKVVHARF